MDKYIVNPKTKGSGILAAIPQKGRCPMECDDCFFQSGRSFLEPLDENLPNMPPVEITKNRVIRINDGNDSNINKKEVMEATRKYPMKFYNTSIANLLHFDEPVVLTINPGEMTDKEWHELEKIPKNLMFVRIRTNMWNLNTVVKPAVLYYTERSVPVVLTFMAYYDTQDKIQIKTFRYKRKLEQAYVFRKRTINSYNAITTIAWEYIMEHFKYNKWVHSCGKIEGEKGDTHCRFCGNCLREYFATIERMRE